MEDRTLLDAGVIDFENRLIGIVGNEGTEWCPPITRAELAYRPLPWLCALTAKKVGRQEAPQIIYNLPPRMWAWHGRFLFNVMAR